MIFLKPQPVTWDDLPKEAQEALLLEVRAYIKAGGLLTVDLWTKLEPAERTAFEFLKSGGVEKEYDALNQIANAIEARRAPKAVE